MSDHHTYKKVEVVGSSRTSIDEAINNALAECAKSIRNLEWFDRFVMGRAAATSP